jgi:hypothetical protein
MTAKEVQTTEPRIKLALQFSIEQQELEVICQAMQDLIAMESAKGLSSGLIAVMLTRLLKHAIDMKFDKRPIIDISLPGDHFREPEYNSFKANVVKGMFLTFIEHDKGFPGFFDIVAGIASGGLGLGKIKLPDDERRITLEELARYYPETEALRNAQIKLMQDLLTPANLMLFPNTRIAVYSLLTGCALLPFYAAAIKYREQEIETSALLEKASAMVSQRFTGNSERLQRFLAQNLFRVLFEELFTHESTVFSIFNS